MKERNEMKSKCLGTVFFFLGFMLFITVSTSVAGVNMDLQHKLTMDNAPLDVVASPDGKFVFILTAAGDIAVFDRKGILQNKIHVGNQVDQIKMDPQGDRLFLTSRSEKTVRIIALDFFVEIDTENSPAKGPRNAPVVLAVFSDFQCPYCARLSPELEQLLKQFPKSVKVVFKNFPLSSHKFAKKAAAAALAAECQGKFWEFHDELFKNYRNLDDKKINEIALKVGLNEAQFNADRHNPETLAKIERDYEEGQAIEVRGIPAIFMNGRRVNNRDIKDLPDMIKKELKKTH